MSPKRTQRNQLNWNRTTHPIFSNVLLVFYSSLSSLLPKNLFDLSCFFFIAVYLIRSIIQRPFLLALRPNILILSVIELKCGMWQMTIKSLCFQIFGAHKQWLFSNKSTFLWLDKVFIFWQNFHIDCGKTAWKESKFNGKMFKIYLLRLVHSVAGIHRPKKNVVSCQEPCQKYWRASSSKCALCHSVSCCCCSINSWKFTGSATTHKIDPICRLWIKIRFWSAHIVQSASMEMKYIKVSQSKSLWRRYTKNTTTHKVYLSTIWYSEMSTLQR